MHQKQAIIGKPGTSQGIILHDEASFAAMRKAGQLTARCLEAVGDNVRPGVNTNEIDRFVFDFGRPEVKVLSDGWTAATRDRSLSAQFEHTLGVTETGCEVFTRTPSAARRSPSPTTD